MSLKYRSDIDGLRAVAVLFVLIYHAFPNSITGGFIGVDIFFVISGYLISGIIIKEIHNGNFSFSRFYARRIKRIFPALTLMLVVTVTAGYFIMMPSDFAVLGQHAAASALSIQNFMLLSESGYFDSSSELKPLLHIWSLGVEEQFYLVWPIALIIIYKFTKRPAFWISAITIISFIFCIIQTRNDSSVAFYAPWFRLWELSIGAVVYSLLNNKNVEIKARPGNILSLIAVFLLAYSAFSFHSDSSFPGYKAVIPVISAALIIGFCKDSLFSKLVLSNKIVVYIGRISYPLYIWHWPLLSFYFYMSPEVTADQDILIRLSLIVTSVILASFTYHFVENKIRYTTGGVSKATISALCSTTAIIVLCGMITYNNSGFPDRFGAELNALASPIDFEWDKGVRGDLCHIMGDEDTLSIAKGRIDNCVVNVGGKNAVIWGDSHAGAAYPGVEFVAKSKGISVTQITGAKRGPLFGVNKYVNEQSEEAIQIISDSKPDYVVLDARWYVYGTPEFVADKIKFAVSKVKEVSPNSKIIVIGQVPEWNGSLQSSLFQLGKTGVVMPKYTDFGLKKETLNYDSSLGELLKSSGISYISPTQILCSQSGCMTAVGNKPTDLTAIDYGHLSKSASIFMLSRSGIFK